jgi:hypothetical protein
VKFSTGIRNVKDSLAAFSRELLSNLYRVTYVKFIASFSSMAQHKA